MRSEVLASCEAFSPGVVDGWSIVSSWLPELCRTALGVTGSGLDRSDTSLYSFMMAKPASSAADLASLSDMPV